MSVQRWAGIRVSANGGADEVVGCAVEDAALPSALRRRMGRLERLAARCAMGVLAEAATDALVFCSRFGNLESVCGLLQTLAEDQLLSPMVFSGSVHNATPGLIAQMRHQRLSHTAVAAGIHTLTCGLTEAYAYLAAGECRNVTLVFADLPLPEQFAAFDTQTKTGLALAMQLETATDDAGSASIAVGSGQTGALILLDSLKQGARHIDLGAVQ